MTALGTILLAANAQAAGFHLREQSAAAQGNAFAGATAGAENGSYSYFNVAGLTRQKGTQLNIGGTYIAPRAEASNVRAEDGSRGADVNNIVHAAVAPNATFSHQLNDKAFLGVALNVPYGMITKYDRDWPGSDHGITSKVMTATVTPMFAYKATDKLSLGAGLQMQYVKARLTGTSNGGAVSTAMEGDAFDIGYQLGAMYEFNENTRVGVAYRSQVKHKLTGDLTASMPLPSLNQDIFAKLNTPEMLSMGVFHQINDKWSVMAEYQRVFWSSFKTLDIHGQEYPFLSSTKEHWRDTNFFAIGASYQIDHQWKWRFGLAYDQSAVRVQHRTPRIPDSDRLWFSTGFEYKLNDDLVLNAGYSYIRAEKNEVNLKGVGHDATRGDLSAKYKGNIHLFGLGFNYRF